MPNTPVRSSFRAKSSSLLKKVVAASFMVLVVVSMFIPIFAPLVSAAQRRRDQRTPDEVGGRDGAMVPHEQSFFSITKGDMTEVVAVTVTPDAYLPTSMDMMIEDMMIGDMSSTMIDMEITRMQVDFERIKEELTRWSTLALVEVDRLLRQLNKFTGELEKQKITLTESQSTSVDKARKMMEAYSAQLTKVVKKQMEEHSVSSKGFDESATQVDPSAEKYAEELLAVAPAEGGEAVKKQLSVVKEYYEQSRRDMDTVRAAKPGEVSANTMWQTLGRFLGADWVMNQGTSEAGERPKLKGKHLGWVTGKYPDPALARALAKSQLTQPKVAEKVLELLPGDPTQDEWLRLEARLQWRKSLDKSEGTVEEEPAYREAYTQLLTDKKAFEDTIPTLTPDQVFEIADFLLNELPSDGVYYDGLSQGDLSMSLFSLAIESSLERSVTRLGCVEAAVATLKQQPASDEKLERLKLLRTTLSRLNLPCAAVEHEIAVTLAAQGSLPNVASHLAILEAAISSMRDLRQRDIELSDRCSSRHTVTTDETVFKAAQILKRSLTPNQPFWLESFNDYFSEIMDDVLRESINEVAGLVRASQVVATQVESDLVKCEESGDHERFKLLQAVSDWLQLREGEIAEMLARSVSIDAASVADSLAMYADLSSDLSSATSDEQQRDIRAKMLGAAQHILKLQRLQIVRAQQYFLQSRHARVTRMLSQLDKKYERELSLVYQARTPQFRDAYGYLGEIEEPETEVQAVERSHTDARAEQAGSWWELLATMATTLVFTVGGFFTWKQGAQAKEQKKAKQQRFAAAVRDCLLGFAFQDKTDSFHFDYFYALENQGELNITITKSQEHALQSLLLEKIKRETEVEFDSTGFSVKTLTVTQERQLALAAEFLKKVGVQVTTNVDLKRLELANYDCNGEPPSTSNKAWVEYLCDMVWDSEEFKERLEALLEQHRHEEDLRRETALEQARKQSIEAKNTEMVKWLNDQMGFLVTSSAALHSSWGAVSEEEGVERQFCYCLKTRSGRDVTLYLTLELAKDPRKEIKINPRSIESILNNLLSELFAEVEDSDGVVPPSYDADTMTLTFTAVPDLERCDGSDEYWQALDQQRDRLAPVLDKLFKRIEAAKIEEIGTRLEKGLNAVIGPYLLASQASFVRTADRFVLDLSSDDGDAVSMLCFNITDSYVLSWWKGEYGIGDRERRHDFHAYMTANGPPHWEGELHVDTAELKKQLKVLLKSKLTEPVAGKGKQKQHAFKVKVTSEGITVEGFSVFTPKPDLNTAVMQALLTSSREYKSWRAEQEAAAAQEDAGAGNVAEDDAAGEAAVAPAEVAPAPAPRVPAAADRVRRQRRGGGRFFPPAPAEGAGADADDRPARRPVQRSRGVLVADELLMEVAGNIATTIRDEAAQFNAESISIVWRLRLIRFFECLIQCSPEVYLGGLMPFDFLRFLRNGLVHHESLFTLDIVREIVDFVGRYYEPAIQAWEAGDEVSATFVPRSWAFYRDNRVRVNRRDYGLPDTPNPLLEDLHAKLLGAQAQLTNTGADLDARIEAVWLLCQAGLIWRDKLKHNYVGHGANFPDRNRLSREGDLIAFLEQACQVRIKLCHTVDKSLEALLEESDVTWLCNKGSLNGAIEAVSYCLGVQPAATHSASPGV